VATLTWPTLRISQRDTPPDHSPCNGCDFRGNAEPRRLSQSQMGVEQIELCPTSRLPTGPGGFTPVCSSCFGNVGCFRLTPWETAKAFGLPAAVRAAPETERASNPWADTRRTCPPYAAACTPSAAPYAACNRTHFQPPDTPTAAPCAVCNHFISPIP